MPFYICSLNQKPNVKPLKPLRDASVPGCFLNGRMKLLGKDTQNANHFGQKWFKLPKWKTSFPNSRLFVYVSIYNLYKIILRSSTAVLW